MELAVWYVVAACSCSLLLAAASLLWCALFSSPSSIHKHLERTQAAAESALTRADGMEVRFLEHKMETTALHEAIEGVLDSVEKKRRQTAAASSKLQLADQPAAQTREEMLAAARRTVYGTG